MTEYNKQRGRMKNKYKTDFQMYSNIIVSLRRKMPFFKEKIRQKSSNKQHFDLIAMLKHFLLMYISRSRLLSQMSNFGNGVSNEGKN